MDKALIAEAIKSIDLLDIHLYSCFVKREEQTNIELTSEVNEKSRLSISADFYENTDEDNDNTKFKGRIISAKITLGHRYLNNKDNILAEIEAVFIVNYTQYSYASDNAISEFLKHNAVYNIWPFWREHAFRISAEARLPKPSIGLKKPI